MLQHCSKRVKIKSQKVLGLIPTFVEVAGEKLSFRVKHPGVPRDKKFNFSLT